MQVPNSTSALYVLYSIHLSLLHFCMGLLGYVVNPPAAITTLISRYICDSNQNNSTHRWIYTTLYCKVCCIDNQVRTLRSCVHFSPHHFKYSFFACGTACFQVCRRPRLPEAVVYCCLASAVNHIAFLAYEMTVMGVYLLFLHQAP